MKNKKDNTELVLSERENYLSTLSAIAECLKISGNNSQVIVIQHLMEALKQENIMLFIKSINSVDMWGGAGAVWEVYIENKSIEIEFQKKMIHLINLMEKTQILGKGIKRIRTLFEEL